MLQTPLTQMFHDSYSHMFSLQLPIIEKLVRPIIVYLVLVLLLRIFGKRELAQLNPFDLVVLLSLSNTVQNAIIGDDNTISGGVLGAFSLLAINWIVARVLFRSQKITRVVEGRATLLVRDGVVDKKAMERESLSMEDLLSALHRQGFTHLQDVRRCELEPNGTFFVEGREPARTDRQHAELMLRIEELALEIKQMREQTGGEAA